MKGLTITSEIIMALGMIVLAVVFSLVSSQVIASQQSGIFSSVQEGMAQDIADNIEQIESFSGSTQITYETPIDLYTLQMKDGKIELDIEGEETKEVRIQTAELEQNKVENADNICISRGDKVSIDAGRCETIETSDLCVGGGCNPNQCQPDLGEDCSNSGCSCGEQDSPASSICAYNHDPNYDPEYIEGGEAVVDLSCINEEYVGVQEEGERCEYDFECSGIESDGLTCSIHSDADSSDSKHCCPEGEAWDGEQCREEIDKFKLAFVPLNQNTGSYDSAVNSQSEFFIENYPFKSCQDQVEIIKVDEVCSVPVGPSSCTDSGRQQTIESIEDCVEDAGHPDYDKAAGIFQNDICGGTLGWSYGPSHYDAVVSTVGFEEVTAHEIGHEYGLNDEYIDTCRYGDDLDVLIDPNSNCLQESFDGDSGIDSSGNWVDDSPYCAGGSEDAPYEVRCRGNKNSAGGRDIMSYGDAPGPRGFAPPAKNHIQANDELTCD